MFKRLVLVLALLWIPTAWASDAEEAEGQISIDLSDKAALQDGARTFVSYCMGCHSAQYQRYGRIARDLAIPKELLQRDLIVADAKPGDYMRSSMRSEDAVVWFGALPPDLTLVAKVRGKEWLYGFLTGFYEDPLRPWGVNNRVFPGIGMPNVFAPLQGHQQCIRYDSTAGVGHPNCKQTAIVSGTGRQTPEQFDKMVRNLVAFLVYSADPNQEHSKQIGWYVLAYLAVLFVFAYMLKREYWKDVK
jgi:ubiquinol-cytochrome c reductase cytochrome c1 subunit